MRPCWRQFFSTVTYCSFKGDAWGGNALCDYCLFIIFDRRFLSKSPGCVLQDGVVNTDHYILGVFHVLVYTLYMFGKVR